MARVFKPTYVKTDRTTGAKTTRELRKWYAEYRDADGVLQKVPGYTDKKATEQLAARLERQRPQRLARCGVPATHRALERPGPAGVRPCARQHEPGHG